MTHHASAKPKDRSAARDLVPRPGDVAVATAGARVVAQKMLTALALAIALSLLLALSLAAVARADVPDVRFCVADTSLVASPDGSFGYTVLLRNNTNAPIVGGTVVLDFTEATGIVLCNEQDPDHDGRILGTTNGAGSVTFHVKAGGASTGRVRVGTALDLITRARPRTTDLDGDLDVDSSDQAALNALLGTFGPNGDLDHNGIVDGVDVALEAGRVGSNCFLTPTNSTTWGQVRALYR
ncbi:MAG: hypothetical protein ABI960_09015 [Candidatus Eisenbacteria bacterium]